MTAIEHQPRARCLRCHRPAVTCLCGDVTPVDNHTEVVILQHPRERFHPVGTAPFARLGLRRCRVEVALGDLKGRMARALRLPPRTALLYPRADAVDLATLPESARPECLLVLDGTWPQSRRLYDHNPWLTELPHLRFVPAEPSGYLVRRPPRPEYLSTIESIVTALSILEPATRGFDDLLVAFARMNARQVAYMRGPSPTPRHQRPRPRVSRRIPQELFSDRLVVVYGECTRSTDRPVHEVLQWVAAEVDAERYFESIIRPRSGLPAERQLEHIGIGGAELLVGESHEAMLERFRSFLGAHAVLAAWNQRTLEIARLRLGFDGPTLLLKAVHANLRGGRRGELDRIAQGEGLAAPELPFHGRAAQRVGDAVAVARWLRTHRRDGSAPGLEPDPV